ncbi:MAG: hypothetical protein H8E72_05855 [Candidatus Marinimicrobia bacterium]|nr:hypothetical protein [Candidatus Neomarinimicrobiota bacterium]
MNYRYILLLLSIFLFSLTCDEQPTLPDDCLGIEGGTAYLDECGICDSDTNNDNVTCFDCTGEINGTHILDECNICDTYTTYGGIKPSYPYGDCDCAGVLDGTATTDYCGICDDDTSNNCIQDCAGTWGGTAENDDCGVCDENISNNNSTCEQDCTGEWGGTAMEDCAGICEGSSVLSGCDNECNSTAVLDNCGVCDSDSSNDCTADCCSNFACCENSGGTWDNPFCWDGTAENDDCGVCNGDNSSCTGCMIQSACDYDPTATIAGICDFAEVGYDCSGNCTLEVDECGICGGDGPEENYDCDGNCSMVIDECNVCGGGGIPEGDCDCFGNVEDCAGECGGSAEVDCSDECRGGTTGLTPYETCGCFDKEANNFWCTVDNSIPNGSCDIYYENCDADCLGGNNEYDNPCNDSEVVGNGECEDNSLFFNSDCQHWGCTDIMAVNYDVNATNCEDYIDNNENEVWDEGEEFTDFCCSYHDYIEIQNVDEIAGTLDIYMDNSLEVGGFQIDFENVTLTGAAGGTAEDAGLSVSANNTTAIGFSMTGSTIPVSSGLLLTSLTFNNPTNICINYIIISDVSGNNMNFLIHHNSSCSE